MKNAGIKAQNLKVTDGAIKRLISGYTAEAGVRGLKKQLDVLCRSAAVKLVKGEQKSISVSEKRLPQFLVIMRSVTNMSWLTRSPASSLVLPGRRQAERFSSLRPPWLPEKATLSSPASWAM